MTTILTSEEIDNLLLDEVDLEYLPEEIELKKLSELAKKHHKQKEYEKAIDIKNEIVTSYKSMSDGDSAYTHSYVMSLSSFI